MKTKLLGIGLMAMLLMAVMVQAGFIALDLTNTTMLNASYPIKVGFDGAITNGLSSVQCQLVIYDGQNSSGSVTGLSVTPVTGIDFGNVTNTSVAQSAWTWTINTNALQDSNDHNVSVFCGNATGASFRTFANASIVVDNTNPTTPTSCTTTEQTSQTFTLSCTVGATNTDTCSAEWFGGIPTSTIPRASHIQNASTCTISVSNANDGDYTYRVTANDGQTQAPSARTSFVVNTYRPGRSGLPAGAAVVTQPEEVTAAQRVSEGAQAVGTGIRSTLQSFWERLAEFFRGLFD